MIVVGLGNLYRRDDGVGLVTLARIHGVEKSYCEGDPLRLMAALDGQDAAIIVDAVLGPRPGRIHRWEWNELPPDIAEPKFSSHSFSLLDALRLLEVSQRLPAQVVLYAVEADDFSWGQGLSPPVLKAVDLLERRLKKEIALCRA